MGELPGTGQSVPPIIDNTHPVGEPVPYRNACRLERATRVLGYSVVTVSASFTLIFLGASGSEPE